MNSFRIPYRPPIRVLVADDDGIQRSVTQHCAVGAWAGADVHLAHDGHEALEMFWAEAPRPFDLVITDWQMPGLNGGNVIRTIRGGDSDVPVIILTALERAGDIGELLEDFEGVLYVEKPVMASEFTAMLMEMGRIISGK